MCSAERRQEIVERHLIHQICDVNRCRESLAFFGMEQIVSAQTEVEYVARSDAIISILSLCLVLLVIFACWELTAQLLYISLFGSTPPRSFPQFIANVLGTPQGWKLIVLWIGTGFIFAAVVLSISVVSLPLLLDRDVGIRVAIETSVKAVWMNPSAMAMWGAIIAARLAIG